MDPGLRQQIIAWLGQREQLAAMQQAIERERPPLEAVDAAFFARFGQQPNPNKQQIGKIVKAIMENRGFKLFEPESAAEVPCVNTQVFLNASRYQRA